MKDLRYRTGQLLKSLRRGVRPRITCRGRPVARLVPLTRADTSTFQAIGFGMWRDHAAMKDVDAWLDAQRAPRRVR